MRKEKLRAIRKLKKYTQQQIADMLATDVSNYSRKENGDVKITEEEWKKIANFLSVPIEDVYEEDEAKEPKKETNEVYKGAKLKKNSYSNADLHIELIKNLMDYITLLKEENKRLKEQIK
ncbi:helix-turn-helix domain-containing protein [Chryseobacterium rhizosphaerae]|uniref:helix-turn-helix domain-containing protein n=1 Tax=Chryseobacterium rhizosphaerae TaxID=395937 RepID=UPI0023593A04|nr:helix-turn-helix transcriptional regulator [Chryseobacterium rhizosphaerae]MDC8099780.1 helix-turn-helix transcriptional regulator [Chryseobacterium rhizosphaerae]